MGRHFRRAIIAIVVMCMAAVAACVIRTGPSGRHRHGVTHKHKHKKHKKHKQPKKHAKHHKHKGH